MSPIRSKRMVFPSGLTSTDIQVPSLVVNEIVRVGFRGRSLNAVNFVVSFFAVSAKYVAGTGMAGSFGPVNDASTAPVMSMLPANATDRLLILAKGEFMKNI